MKKSALVLVSLLLPGIAIADRMSDPQNDALLEKATAQAGTKVSPKVAVQSEPKFSQEIRKDREGVYRDTLNRLIRIEEINTLPATASGSTGESLSSCNYAQNVLLEYQLELERVKPSGNSDARIRRLKRHVAVWKNNVRQCCN
ncbi:MAG: hypothetical protein CSB48_03470 [Proteobacteria bacterium]|nr:MAG: hypothetical protein CSB48_03470 [Pseudomonadota bacterium]